ncbi:MAG: hypothetical protein LBQ51_04580, partial [Desulfovibrio sp.]|nr:hypothetical protein [Desulfovibrio sp.]
YDPWPGCSSLLAFPFHAAPLSVRRPAVQPVESLFNFRQRMLIFPTGEVSRLEALQAVTANFEQVFNENAVHIGFLDRTILENDLSKNTQSAEHRIVVASDFSNLILVIRPARARCVQYRNFCKSVLPLW